MDDPHVDLPSASRNGRKARRAGARSGETRRQPRETNGLGPSHEDALNAYLSHMARLPLLSREGEVRVGQEIEEGTRQAYSALFACPITVHAMGEFVQRVRAQKVRVAELVRDADDEETFDEIQAEERLAK